METTVQLLIIITFLKAQSNSKVIYTVNWTLRCLLLSEEFVQVEEGLLSKEGFSLIRENTRSRPTAM